MDDSGNSQGDPAPPPKASLFKRASAPKPAPSPREPKVKRRRRLGLSNLSGVLSFLLVFAFVVIAGLIGAQVAVRKTGPLNEDKTVILTREDDDGPIGDQLERAGVIESSTLFSLMTLVDGQRSALKRGEYAFKAGINMREVEDMLAHHRVVRHKLSIPEGLTSEQIIERVRDSDLLVGELKDIPREGSLYPDTYVFERGDTRQALVAHMASEMTKIVTDIWKKKAPDLPIKSPGELVTLASIVEKETGRSDERSRVAGVFVNRLQKHMKLQSDPTIVYGLVFGKGTLGHSITKAELQEPTAYNTYFIEGLPPGPICNPGRAAMEAVANPARTHDLFFVADGSGGHAFAETLDQHAKNVANWRKIEKDAKDRLSPDAAPPANNIRGEAPDLSGSRYGLSGPGDPNAFGALATAPPSPTQAAPAAQPAATDAPPGSPLAAKLAKLADQRRRVAELTGAGGRLSSEKLAGGIDTLGAVVMGVNDPPPGSDEASAPQVDASLEETPLSPAALADLRARAARYGLDVTPAARNGEAAPLARRPASAARGAPDGDPAAGLFVSPQGASPQNLREGLALAGDDTQAVPAARPRPRAFDASEGTALDPLRNRTWDLNYAKQVPANLNLQ
jgi:UPF0755 protein